MIRRFFFAHGYHPRRLAIYLRGVAWYYYPHAVIVGLMVAAVVAMYV